MRIRRTLGRVVLWAVDALALRPRPVFRTNSLERELASRNSAFLTRLPQNTVVGCNDLAVADLLEASTSTDRHERKHLERSAERWSQRAAMLERMKKSFRKRAALDDASREFQRDRLPTTPPHP
jgi:hypothetical protein